MDWNERYERIRPRHMHSVDYMDADLVYPRTVDTWAGCIDTQMYGDNLQRLCQATSGNIERLKESLKTRDRNRMKIEINKNGGMRMKANAVQTGIKTAWSDTNVMFTNADAIKSLANINDDDSASVVSFCENVVPVNKYCYLCSTLEEHQRHMLHSRPRRPSSGKVKIEYIAPRPKVKRKKKEREIAVHENLYKVDVFTGDVVNAGTDANVSITIKGSRDILYKTKLSKSRGSVKFCFMRNSKETFYLKGPKLGNLEIITIEHDGLEKKYSWYLEKIEITDMQTEQKWTFYCKQWLSLHIKDYRIKRDLIGKQQELPINEYTISVTTGKKSFAGTDANVFILLYGTEGQSKKIHLVDTTSGKKAFEKGKTDTFTVAIPSLGELKKLRVEHDSKGFAAGWFLDKIVVQSSENKRRYYFVYNGWIGKDIGDGKLFREIKAQRSIPKEVVDGIGALQRKGTKTRYVVSVRTGDVRYAGTDADVFVVMFGDKGTTSKIKLDDERNNFERGMMDSFEIDAVDVGSLKKILIGHDNSGAGAGWFLDDVTIRRYLSKPEVIAYLKKVKKQLNQKKKQKGEEIDELEHGMKNMGRERRNSRPSSAMSCGSRRPSSAHSDDSRSVGLGGRRGSASPSVGGRRHSNVRNKREKESVSDTSSSESSDSDDDDDDDDDSDMESRRKRKRMQQKRREQQRRRQKDEEPIYKVPLYEEYYFVCKKWLAKDEGDGLYERELQTRSKQMFFKD